MVQEETDKTANDIQTRLSVARNWKDMSEAAQRKETQQWAIEKPNLDNTRGLRVIYFIDQNVRRKFEVPMPAAMPCKSKGVQYSETCRTSGIRQTKYACIVEAGASTRKRMEGTLHKGHEDHFAGRGINSLNHYNLVHKCIPVIQAMNIPDAKAAVDKEREKLEKIPA